MKGLILNNFYSMRNSIKLVLAADLLMFISWYMRSNGKVYVMIFMQIMLFSISCAVLLQEDENSRWNKLEITFPIKRIAVINARYLTILILAFIGYLISLLSIFFFSLRGIEMNYTELISVQVIGLYMVIGTFGLAFPLILMFGADKTDFFILISFVLAFIASIILWNMINSSYPKELHYLGNEMKVILMAAASVEFALSYFISISIHADKEF